MAPVTNGRRIPLFPHETALGETLKFNCRIKNQNDNTVPLAGYTARYAIVDQKGVEVLGFDPVIADDLILVRALVDGIKPGTYQHALRVMNGEVEELVLFRGDLKIYSDLAGFA